MSGHSATTEGTAKYRARFLSKTALEHFRYAQDLWFSSIGLGTYLGDPDERTDKLYEEAVCAALDLGCNMLDTAINYRFQRSERSIGSALKKSIAENKIQRDEVIISTKGGFLSFDGDYPPNPAKYFHEEFIDRGLCKKEDIVANCHCITPAYLENQIDRSLKNLAVECLDIYFIHNPETQLQAVSRDEFNRRMLEAFRTLEAKVQEGKISMYGVATWDGFRHTPDAPAYLSLAELLALAREAGGEKHYFRVVQLPHNLAMPEAFLRKNQKMGSETLSLIEAAAREKMVVMSSASILQGQLATSLPPGIAAHFKELRSDAQRSIQFVRSTPGVTTALVGMSRKPHVAENLQTASHPPLPLSKFKELYAE